MAGIVRSKRLWAGAAVALTALFLAGCSSVPDSIPTALGGLPEGVPPRPQDPGAYPAVHDTPPDRDDAALSQAETKRLREELTQTRTRILGPNASSSSGDAGSARRP